MLLTRNECATIEVERTSRTYFIKIYHVKGGRDGYGTENCKGSVRVRKGCISRKTDKRKKRPPEFTGVGKNMCNGVVSDVTDIGDECVAGIVMGT